MATFTFAWVDEGDSFVARDDEDVYSFDIAHAEGEFATLRVEILNPRAGLLAPARKQWCWFGMNDGGTGGDTPLFYGRIVGIPESVTEEIVSLTFMARPSDYDEQKATLAESLRVAPYWDPIWVNPEQIDNPDVVLESRPQAWHIDRVTHVVTVSDIIEGEDGFVTLADDEMFYDSLEIGFKEAPVSRISCQGTVRWDQAAIGTINLTGTVNAAFAAAGSPYGYATSYTGEGLQDDWPEKGDSIGAGWTVGRTESPRVDGIYFPTTLYTMETTDARVGFPLWYILPVFFADYEVHRSRTETISFTMDADVQPLVSEPTQDSVLDLKLSTDQISALLDSGGTVAPIGDIRRPTYFKQDRGKQSLEYLIVMCRARLLARARAVTVSREIDFDVATTLSCRKSVIIPDDRLPGGGATGKVISYGFSLNGDTGQAIGRVAIGCTVGRGGTLVDVAADPAYVDGGYVADGYQAYSGGATALAGGSITYSAFDTQAIDDDGLDLLNLNATSAVIACTVSDGQTEQETVLNGGPYADVGEAIEALNEAYTEVGLELLPLTGGPFETNFTVTVSDLMIPQTIDLETA